MEELPYSQYLSSQGAVGFLPYAEEAQLPYSQFLSSQGAVGFLSLVEDAEPSKSHASGETNESSASVTENEKSEKMSGKMEWPFRKESKTIVKKKTEAKSKK